MSALLSQRPLCSQLPLFCSRVRDLGSFIVPDPTTSSRRLSTMSATTPMQRSNRLRTAFMENRGPSYGIWQMLPGANISRALARANPDWITVDCEHGNIDDAAMHEAIPAISSCGVSPVVRIPDFQSWMIKRALDAGAHGILVPLIRTVDEVKQVVAAAKFPPEGRRGFGSAIAMQNFNPVPSFTEYLQQANAALLTMVQIETKEALDVVEEIAPLVDVLFIGPFDLGNNMGYPIIDGDVKPQLKEAISRILKAAKGAGKKCGMYATNGEEAAQYGAMGFDMINVGTDVTTMESVMRQSMAAARGSAGLKGKGYGS
ncbi:4-hydroxy-2-oxo-heptane-1,7-dioate aldolase [Cytospora mali]|uniref:4-hydroxy-2-oxo-heptane-1,7-dioate aldolase n=1 Tax=Cytospora mali TaxID=578113 RepID=A0A194VNY2_CYTMA|nr:4-hydroxy-2-oxo-heptane-1,7-dioate aldolase [Valsa mali]